MNLNKTEKLLAARKRLKEFQLNKKLHVQDGSIKDQNDGPEAPQIQTEDSIAQKPQQQNDSEHMPQVISIPADDQNLHIDTDSANLFTKTEMQINNVVANAINNENETANKEILEQKSLASASNATEYCLHTNNVDPLNTQADNHSHNNEDQYNYSSASYDTVAAQKEQLLHMASAVSNALAETANDNEFVALERDTNPFHNFVNNYMADQNKSTIHQLHIQVSQYSSRVAELEAILATKDAEFETKLAREVSPLKEQLQIHTQTTGILIAEKAELSGALTQCQLTVKHNAQEIEELSGKLKSSQIRINDLEKELALTKLNNEEAQKATERIQREYAALNEKHLELRKEKEDLDLGISEVKQKLNVKNTEITNLQRELHEKTALLSLNELRIQQLTNTAQEMQVLEGQHQTVMVLEQQLAQMRDALKTLTHEKDEASKQYQNYVRQLDIQQSKLINELESEKKMIKSLEEKEQSYIDRLSELERQLQSEKNRVETLLPLQDQKVRTDTLTKNMDEQTLEYERLLITLSEKDNEIKALTAELEEFRNTNEQTVEASKLAQALESEQLGASRAVSQNQQLKQELSEMHDAFVSLSNSKLDLTEKLQAERSIGRKLNAQLNIIENNMKELTDQLKQKEAYVVELEKEKLQTAQITDQIQHYQVQSQQTSTLQQELQNALAYIERLKKENAQLVEKLRTSAEPPKQKQEENVDISTDGLNSSANNEETRGETTNTAFHQEVEVRTEATQASLDLSEPIKKLEQRFKETMEKVAELTDEKQRLEHLVLQLQSETETIGEYITLYQRQRAVLQERSKEKDQAFRQLLTQRNQQQEQLHKLKVLITDLMTKNPNIRQHNLESPVPNHTEPDIIISPKNNDESDSTETTKLIKDETTSQILDVLSEIKDCNKDNCILEPNLHLCPWCSGKLITI